MLHVLTGEDDYSQTMFLDEIKKGIGDPLLLSANTTLLEGQTVTLDELRRVSATLPFLAEKRLVIIPGLLGRFEKGEGKPRGKKKPGAPAKEAEYKTFADYLTSLPESTVVVLTDGKIKAANPLLKALAVKVAVRSFPLMREIQLRKWVEIQINGQGSSIAPEAAALLARLVGSNLWTMTGEINKLVLYALGRRIEVEDVKKSVSSAQEASVFALVDAVLDFNAAPAESLLERLMQDGATPAYLMAMIARQLRMIVQTKAMIKRREPEGEIQARLGMIAEFALRKTLEQARRYPLERFKEVYIKLLETDMAIKTGKYDGALALNLLIADLCPERPPAR
jgi:DNA polymerase III subunit delta